MNTHKTTLKKQARQSNPGRHMKLFYFQLFHLNFPHKTEKLMQLQVQLWLTRKFGNFIARKASRVKWIQPTLLSLYGKELKVITNDSCGTKTMEIVRSGYMIPQNFN